MLRYCNLYKEYPGPRRSNFYRQLDSEILYIIFYPQTFDDHGSRLGGFILFHGLQEQRIWDPRRLVSAGKMSSGEMAQFAEKRVKPEADLSRASLTRNLVSRRATLTQFLLCWKRFGDTCPSNRFWGDSLNKIRLCPYSNLRFNRNWRTFKSRNFGGLRDERFFYYNFF